MARAGFISKRIRPWIEARQRHRLSHAQVQMARELGMNPKKLGGRDNADQEPWKMPLPRYIEHLYRKQFGQDAPADLRPIEVREAEKKARKEQKRQERRARREGEQQPS